LVRRLRDGELGRVGSVVTWQKNIQDALARVAAEADRRAAGGPCESLFDGVFLALLDLNDEIEANPDAIPYEVAVPERVAMVHRMLPVWPHVRCEGCRRIYEQPILHFNLTGATIPCPNCGHATFDTTMMQTGVFADDPPAGTS
jgi:hypothetical protein